MDQKVKREMEERGEEAAVEKEKQGPETTSGAAEEADDVTLAELSLSRIPKLKPKPRPKPKPMPMPLPKSNLNPDSNSIVPISSSSSVCLSFLVFLFWLFMLIIILIIIFVWWFWCIVFVLRTAQANREKIKKQEGECDFQNS